MPIERIEIRRLNLELTKPYKVAYTTFHAFQPIVAEIFDSDGRYGFGEAEISPGYTDETPEGGWALLKELLPRLIGLSRAKEMSFTGNTIDAQQAYDWGLVNRVLEPEQLLPAAEQMAADMCSCVPAILPQYKRLIDDGYSMSLIDALEYEAAIGIESAKAATAAMIAMRKEKVLKRGREQGEKE